MSMMELSPEALPPVVPAASKGKVKLREFTTGAAVLENAARTRAYWRSLQGPEPRQTPAPSLKAPPLVPVPVVSEAIQIKIAIACRAQPNAEPRLPRPKGPTVEDIIRAVCARCHISRVELLSVRRTAAVVRPRHMAMYLATKLTMRSLPDIGRRFGGRDHTTVFNAARRMEQRRAVSMSLNADLLALELELDPRFTPPADPNQLTLPLLTEASTANSAGQSVAVSEDRS